MGLDMYAFTTKEQIQDVDFDRPSDTKQIFQWRKHPDLHGWMQKLYRKRGGENEDFNLSPLRLDAADIDALEKAVAKNRLPHTQGFFFGESQPEDKKDDVEFIHRARDALGKGFHVFYLAWW